MKFRIELQQEKPDAFLGEKIAESLCDSGINAVYRPLFPLSGAKKLDEDVVIEERWSYDGPVRYSQDALILNTSDGVPMSLPVEDAVQNAALWLKAYQFSPKVLNA